MSVKNKKNSFFVFLAVMLLYRLCPSNDPPYLVFITPKTQLFTRVLRDSTPRFVGPLVRPSVRPSVTLYFFFVVFGPLGMKTNFFSLFSRVLRDSTPRFVGPSVGPSVRPSVHPSVRPSVCLSVRPSVTFYFLIIFVLFTSLLLPKWS